MLDCRLSTLFLITVNIKNEDTTYIIFANFREELSSEVYDVRHMKTVTLFQDGGLTYKQHFFIGNKEEVLCKYEELLSEKKLEIGNKKFLMECEIEKNKEDKDWANLDNYEKDDMFRIKEYSYKNYESLDRTDFIYHYSELCKYLKDKKEDKFSKKIYPAHFISLNELDSFLNKRIVVRLEELFIIETFRGVDGDKKLGPKKYSGKIKYVYNPYKEISVCITNEEKERYDIDSLRWVSINSKTGKWEYELPYNTPKGIILYKDDVSRTIIAGSRFHMIMEIDINTSIMDSTLINLYKEEIKFSKSDIKEKKCIKAIEKRTFLKKLVIPFSKKKYSKEVSKYLEETISNLGDEIVIIDPYLLGNLESSQINYSQIAFINAILMVLTKYKIKKIIFIGCKKKVLGKEPYYVEEHYEKLKKNFTQLQDVEIEYRILNRDLHDRYLIGLTKKIVVACSGSINGLISNNEVSFEQKDEITSKRIIRTFFPE